MEGKSLKGGLGKVEKGDCIVTFKRSSVFAIKKDSRGGEEDGDEVCCCLWMAAA